MCRKGSFNTADTSGYLLAMGVIAFLDCTPGRQQDIQYVWLLMATTVMRIKKKHNKRVNKKFIFLRVAKKKSELHKGMTPRTQDLKQESK